MLRCNSLAGDSGHKATKRLNESLDHLGPRRFGPQRVRRWEVELGLRDLGGAGDIVMLYEDGSLRSQWPLAHVINVEKGKDDLVRGVDVKLADGRTFRRSIQKITLLLEVE